MSSRAKIREEARKLNPIDDLMFRKMAEDPAFCEEILRVILSDPELSVLESIPQYAAVRDGSEVSELMKVFVEDDAYNSKFPITSDGKRRYKKTEEGQRIMCEIMEKIAREERKEGETRINKLNSILIDMNRMEDLKRATRDTEYQTQLMLELLANEI